VDWRKHSVVLAYCRNLLFNAYSGTFVLNRQQGDLASVIALRTWDGGQTWEQESLPAHPGFPFLSPDGQILTVIENDKTCQAGFSMLHAITVYRYQQPL
jgi:hypothetical protein